MVRKYFAALFMTGQRGRKQAAPAGVGASLSAWRNSIALALLFLAAPALAGPDSAACSAGAICVGPDQAITSLNQAAALARPGDRIEMLPGLYHESAALSTPGLTVRGLGEGAHIDCSGLPPAGAKACLLLVGDGITLDNLEISGAAIPEAAGANAACVRNQPGRDFTLRRIRCHDSQNGILTDGGRPVIEDSEFYGNGWSGLTHDAYFGGNCSSLVIRRSIFRDARVGHELKSRCRENRIADTVFLARSGSRALDFPDGGEVEIEGGEIVQELTVRNRDMIAYAAESCEHPGQMTIRGMRIVGRNPAGTIANYDKCPAPILLIDLRFDGLKPWLRGRILVRESDGDPSGGRLPGQARQ